MYRAVSAASWFFFLCPNNDEIRLKRIIQKETLHSISIEKSRQIFVDFSVHSRKMKTMFSHLKPPFSAS